jgi:hypothetical protein
MGTYGERSDNKKRSSCTKKKRLLRHPIHYGLTKVSRINERLIQRGKETVGGREIKREKNTKKGFVRIAFLLQQLFHPSRTGWKNYYQSSIYLGGRKERNEGKKKERVGTET